MKEPFEKQLPGRGLPPSWFGTWSPQAPGSQSSRQAHLAPEGGGWGQEDHGHSTQAPGWGSVGLSKQQSVTEAPSHQTGPRGLLLCYFNSASPEYLPRAAK